MLEQILSLVGAALILAAYFGYQLNKIDRRNWSYNAMNLVGSSLLTWVAVHDGRWGFIALEAIWALISVPPLVQSLRAR